MFVLRISQISWQSVVPEISFRYMFYLEYTRNTHVPCICKVSKGSGVQGVGADVFSAETEAAAMSSPEGWLRLIHGF